MSLMVLIYHPELPETQLPLGRPVRVSLDSVDDHAARGWLLVDPDVTPPPPSTPWYPRAEADSKFLTEETAREALLPRWKPAEVVTANDFRLSPDGTIIKRTANGTTRANWDATEIALWTVVAGGGGGGGTDPETVRDLVGATIVAGPGMTKVVDDAGDTVTLAATARPGGDAPATWIAAFHRGPSPLPQSERLHIGVSSDGLSWRTYMPDFTPPSGTVRDPHLFKHNGRWYVAYTSIAFGNGTTFGLAVSDDLVTWEHLPGVSVASLAGATQVWAPKAFVDTDGLHFLVSINVGGALQPYELRPTNQNDLGGTYTTPVKFTGAGIPSNALDAHVTKVGSTYHLFAKDNTNSNSYIIHSTATALTGPYAAVGAGNWAGWGGPFEAPVVVDMGSGANPRYRLYFDEFNRGQLFYAESNDLTTFGTKKLAWTDLVAPRHFGARLIGADPVLRGVQERVDRSPVPSGDRRQYGLLVPNAPGWAFGANKPGNGSVVGRVARFPAPRDMRIGSANFHVTAAATANDAVDLGIFDEAMNLIASSGPVTGLLNSGIGIKSINLASKVQLRAGRVYFAGLSLAGSTGTAVTLRSMNAQSDADSMFFAGNIANQHDGYFQDVHPWPARLVPASEGGSAVPSMLIYAVALIEG